MDTRRFTHIGRPVDPAWPTNRAIALITVATGLIAGGVVLATDSLNVTDTALVSFRTAAAVFLAWAMTREIDPDHQAPAFVAAGLALLGIVYANMPPPVLPVVWLLLCVRIVNRSTGLAPRLADLILVSGLGIWLATNGYPMAAAATGAAIWLNHRVDGRSSLWLPGLATALVLTTPLAWMSDAGSAATAGTDWALLLAAVGASALFVASTRKSGPPQSLDDEGVHRLSARRMRYARALGLITCILVLSFAGNDGFTPFIAFWAAALAVGIRMPGAPDPASTQTHLNV